MSFLPMAGPTLGAEPGEAVWGGGEQMSYLALNGRAFPIWTSEPGVGRDKSTELTRRWMRRDGRGRLLEHQLSAADLSDLALAGGALHGRGLFGARFHRSGARTGFEVWAAGRPRSNFLRPMARRNAGRRSCPARFGRQPPLPDWAIGGAIVGLKDGRAVSPAGASFIEAGTPFPGCGARIGRASAKPALAAACSGTGAATTSVSRSCPRGSPRLAARGIRFLAYANPYLCNDGILYEEARKAGISACGKTATTLSGRFRRVRLRRDRFHPCRDPRLVCRKGAGPRNARHRHRRVDGRFR
jgi:alpha-glucosidase